jgi:hypothetical protein
MTADPSPLLAAIDAALAALDLTPERAVPCGRALHLRGRSADLWLVVWADESTQWIACRCVFPRASRRRAAPRWRRPSRD